MLTNVGMLQLENCLPNSVTATHSFTLRSGRRLTTRSTEKLSRNANETAVVGGMVAKLRPGFEPLPRLVRE
jgi:hypothetical protein